jgi:hypothetical protein
MINKELSSKNYERHILCSNESKKLIEEDCKKEFLNHHPEFKGLRLSNGFILSKIIKYYLEQ